MPLILFAILFGLSMDYEVFLVSRIRQAFTGGATARGAMTEGIGNIGRVILAARDERGGGVPIELAHTA
jgi:putative drug exporter of the RND superfamily